MTRELPTNTPKDILATPSNKIDEKNGRRGRQLYFACLVHVPGCLCSALRRNFPASKSSSPGRGREGWVTSFFSLSKHCVKVQLSIFILDKQESRLGKRKKRLLLASTQWKWFGQDRSFFQTNSAASTTYQVMDWLCRSCQLPQVFMFTNTSCDSILPCSLHTPHTLPGPAPTLAAI